MSPDDARHGTYAGYQRHRIDREVACETCRDANRAYMADFRARRPDVAERGRGGRRAASRALWRLADMHRDEYDRLYADELRAENMRKSVAS